MSKVVIPVVAMFCITVLEWIALSRGIDGAILGVSIAAIAGIGGYAFRHVLNKGDDK